MKRKSDCLACDSCHGSESTNEEWLRCEKEKILEKYNKRLASMEEMCAKKCEYEKMESIPRYMILDYRDVCTKIESLRVKLQDYENGVYEDELMETYDKRRILNTYKYNVENSVTRKRKMKMTDLSDDSSKGVSSSVVDVTGNDIDNLPDNSDQVYMVNSNICPTCEVPMLKEDNMMTCLKCSATSFIVDDSNLSMTYDDDMEYSNFTYKRLNHLNEWLNQIQCREHVELSDELLNQVMEVLYENNIRSSDKIKTSDIRDALKKLKKRKYYENCVSILTAITNRKPPRLHPSVEEQIRIMFLSIQSGFQKHCPRNRRNFLSYSYVLFKFFELLGLDEYLCYFSLLKGADKLHRQDVIFSKLCKELDWEFIPSC